jgi:hypothetical protein
MSVSATWVKDSPLGLALMFHFLLKGLQAGLNVVNPQTLITDNSIYSYSSMIPTFAFIQSSYDGTHTTPSKVMVDQATLTATTINVYCDATGSLWADLVVF